MREIYIVVRSTQLFVALYRTTCRGTEEYISLLGRYHRKRNLPLHLSTAQNPTSLMHRPASLMRRSSSVLPVLLAALLPLSLVLTACDSSGSGGAVDNEFTMTIEPQSNSSSAAVEAQQEQVNGFSFFYDAENPNTGEQAFGIYLSDAESFSEQEATKGLFGFVARDAEQPSAGDYSFTGATSGGDPTRFIGALYKDFSEFQSAPFYTIDSGTLSLDTSNDDEVAGSIEASGTKFTFSGSSVEQQPVTITGEFRAKDVDTFVEFNTPGL